MAELALRKAKKEPWDINNLFGGDLLDQIVSATFSARSLGILSMDYMGHAPLHLTMSLAAPNVGYADNVLCVTPAIFVLGETIPISFEMVQRPPTPHGL